MIIAIGRWIPCVVLALLAAAAGAGFVRESLRTRPLPPPPIVAEAPPAPLMVAARQPLGGPVETAHYAVIALRNLFAASRGESTAEVPTAATGPKPFLHGVVLDGPQSRAYLEDPVGQRVAGYALGDAVGGGKLVRILEDRVVIRRADGPIEVMLKDPAKPAPPPPLSTTSGTSAPAPADAPAAPDAAAAPAPAPTTESTAATPAPAAPAAAAPRGRQ